MIQCERPDWSIHWIPKHVPVSEVLFGLCWHPCCSISQKICCQSRTFLMRVWDCRSYCSVFYWGFGRLLVLSQLSSFSVLGLFGVLMLHIVGVIAPSLICWSMRNVTDPFCLLENWAGLRSNYGCNSLFHTPSCYQRLSNAIIIVDAGEIEEIIIEFL